jgi:hypothetical protein
VIPDPIWYCRGLDGEGCGRYAMRSAALKAKWHVGDDGYTCPKCWQARVKARVRAALANGTRLGTKDLSPAEREAAEQVLGPELLEIVDGGWGEERRETPPYGVPMGAAPTQPGTITLGTWDAGRPITVDDIFAAEKTLREANIPKFDWKVTLARWREHEARAALAMRIVQHQDDGLFAELSALYDACRARSSPGHFRIDAYESLSGKFLPPGWQVWMWWEHGVRARCLVRDTLTHAPTWDDLKPRLDRALRQLMGANVKEW